MSDQEQNKPLLQEVAQIAGLSHDLVTSELGQILDLLGTCPEKMTLQELREAMALYVHHVMTLENTPEKQED